MLPRQQSVPHHAHAHAPPHPILKHSASAAVSNNTAVQHQQQHQQHHKFQEQQLLQQQQLQHQYAHPQQTSPRPPSYDALTPQGSHQHAAPSPLPISPPGSSPSPLAGSSSSGSAGGGGGGFPFGPLVTLESLRAAHRAFSAARSWGQFHTPRNLLFALVGEVGELAEVFQWKGEVAEGVPDFSVAERQNLSDELADVLLYLVALADRCHVDLSAAALAKMEKNEAKYPAGMVRGSSRKYNEYEQAQQNQYQQQPQQQQQQHYHPPPPQSQHQQMQQHAHPPQQHHQPQLHPQVPISLASIGVTFAAPAPPASSSGQMTTTAARTWPPPPPAINVEEGSNVVPDFLASPMGREQMQQSQQQQQQASASSSSSSAAAPAPASASSLVSPTHSKKVSFASGTASGVAVKSGQHYIGGSNAAGQPHGFGTLYRADGSIERAGSWKDGMQHGRGRHLRSDGGKYEGEFTGSKKNGLGRFVYPDGAIYEGEWFANQAHGFGVKWDKSGVMQTCGIARNNALVESCPVPRSKLLFGSFLSPAASKGADLIMPDGGFFRGGVSSPNEKGEGGAHQPQGQGTHFRPDGSEAASGEWVGGVLHGKGKCNLPNGEQYEGDFTRGQRHGYGSCLWGDDGTTYSGEWAGGQMSGLGRQVLPSGHSYEGEFVADQVCGLGMMWDPEGHVLVCGRWEDAALVETNRAQT